MKPKNTEKHPSEDRAAAPSDRDGDHTLVKSAMSGDMVAFDSLVVRHRQLVLNIARNEAIMWYRSAQRWREVSMVHVTNTGETIPMDFPDRRSDPEMLFCQKESYQRLFSAIACLNPDARAAIELTDLEEQSNAAVALQLGITVAALKTRKVRGRVSLRRKLSYLQSHDGLLAASSDVVGSALHLE